MRSMFSGVSGLRVHQTKMDVIGNNIANVNTVGYKSQRVTFSDVFSQTISGASSASDDTGRGGVNAMQVGLGVNVSSIDMLMTQGAAQRTDNPFDLMINGDEFIVVSDASGRYFTRDGALRLDEGMNLCIPNGMKVQGWQAVEDTDTNSETYGEYVIRKGEVSDINLSVNQTMAAKATDKVTFSGNIDASSNEDPVTSIRFYDSLGNYFTATITLEKTGSSYTPKVTKVIDEDGNELGTLTTDATTGKQVITPPAVTITPNNGGLTFDNLGQLDKTDKTKPTTIDFEINVGTSKLYKKCADGTYGTGKDYTGKIESKITANCDGVTQFKSKTTVESQIANGNKAGSISGYSIDNNGIVTATYTNGELRKIAQVAVAGFDNPAGLEKVGDNLYSITSNSGDFDGIGKAGNFNTGVLEMSNVDLSSEFTDMIITQRGFQANSRIISVSDEMLQELTNLKR